jgi:hypothetical protein
MEIVMADTWRWLRPYPQRSTLPVRHPAPPALHRYRGTRVATRSLRWKQPVDSGISSKILYSTLYAIQCLQGLMSLGVDAFAMMRFAWHSNVASVLSTEAG